MAGAAGGGTMTISGSRNFNQRWAETGSSKWHDGICRYPTDMMATTDTLATAHDTRSTDLADTYGYDPSSIDYLCQCRLIEDFWELLRLPFYR